MAAPSTPLLPGPQGPAEESVAAFVLAAAFVLGLAFARRAFFAFVLLAVLEGAIRKWLVNGITVFLVKDFLLLGIYAAVLPRLSRAELRRPWWLLAPLAGLLALALLSVVGSDSWSQGVVGLRSYLIYVPLLWVAPRLLDRRRRALGLVLLVLVLGVLESVLGAAQALSGPGALNKLVSGAYPALITIRGIAYLRPSGTFMQVGVFAAFLVFPVVTAFALVGSFRRGKLLAAGLLALVVLSWGVFYSSARFLFGSAVLAGLVLMATLGARRRIFSLLAVPAAFALGFALMLNVVPFVERKAEGLFRSEITPAEAKHLPAGNLRTQLVQTIDANGKVVVVKIITQRGSAKVAGGYFSRAAGLAPDRARYGIYKTRIKPQLKLIARQRVVGHGTGTMTLGSEYALPGTRFAGEGQYTKLAWELGLPGLAVFAWFLGAMLAAALRGVRAASDWRRLPALVGLAASAFLPLWMTLTFALDFPVVAILYYIFAGYAVALGTSSSGSAPALRYSASERRPASLPAKAGRS